MVCAITIWHNQEGQVTMSIVDNADAIYFMSEPHGSQGPETAIPHDTTGYVGAFF